MTITLPHKQGAVPGGAAHASVPISMGMRPITTYITIMVVGGSGLGKTSCIRDLVAALVPDFNYPASPPVLTTDAVVKPNIITLPPVPVTSACRELHHTFLDFPGHGCTLNSAGYVRSVLDVLLQQQRLDYEHLHGSRGMDKSVARGCLQHTVSLAVYMLPPAGPGALDLLLMSMLAKHTSVVPVLSQVGASDEAALQRTRELLAKPEALVPGLEGSFPTLAPCPKPTDSGSSSSSSSGSPRSAELPQLACINTKDSLPHASTVPSLLQLVASNETYTLLDTAWERYSSFCNTWEKHDRDMVRMLDDAYKADVEKWLVDPAVVKKNAETARQQHEKLAKELLEQQRQQQQQWQQRQQQQQQQQQLLDEKTKLAFDLVKGVSSLATRLRFYPGTYGRFIRDASWSPEARKALKGVLT